MTITYYYEMEGEFYGQIEANSDEEARKRAPEGYLILYRESETENGLPFIEI